MQQQVTSTTLPLSTVLLAIFVTLRLCDVIAWSWIWVLSPLWIPLAAAAAIMTGALIIYGVWRLADFVAGFFRHLRTRRKRPF